MATFPTPPTPTALSPLVPLNSPMVGFASPFDHTDGQNRDIILESIRAWASQNLLTWSGSWQTFFTGWIASISAYITANAIAGYSWRSTVTPISSTGNTTVIIVPNYSPLLVGDLIADTSALINYGVVTAVVDPTHAIVTYIGSLRGVPGPNTVPTDAAIAAAVGTVGTLSRIALDKIYSASIRLETYPGVDPTGAVECSAAIQSAIAAGKALKIPVVSSGGFYSITSTIVIEYDVDFSRAVFNYSGTGVAVQVGNAIAPPNGGVARLTVKTPFLINLLKTVAAWSQVAGSVGVQLVNANNCVLYIANITNFEDGFQAIGVGLNGGVTYCKIFMGSLVNNKKNIHITTSGTGYSNQNLVFGGTLNYANSEASPTFGTRHIVIDNASSPIDGWNFIGTAIEDSGAVAEYTIECWGNNNSWSNCRYEVYGGIPHVYWGNGSYDNFILGGINVDAIIETINGVTLNKIVRLAKDKILTATKIFDNTDFGKTIVSNVATAITYTLPQVDYFSPNTFITVRNVGVGVVTINSTANTINGAASVTIPQWSALTFYSQMLPTHTWIAR